MTIEMTDIEAYGLGRASICKGLFSRPPFHHKDIRRVHYRLGKQDALREWKEQDPPRQSKLDPAFFEDLNKSIDNP